MIEQYAGAILHAYQICRQNGDDHTTAIKNSKEVVKVVREVARREAKELAKPRP